MIIYFHFPRYLVEKKLYKRLSSNNIHVLNEFICQKDAKRLETKLNVNMIVISKICE